MSDLQYASMSSRYNDMRRQFAGNMTVFEAFQLDPNEVIVVWRDTHSVLTASGAVRYVSTRNPTECSLRFKRGNRSTLRQMFSCLWKSQKEQNRSQHSLRWDSTTNNVYGLNCRFDADGFLCFSRLSSRFHRSVYYYEIVCNWYDVLCDHAGRQYERFHSFYDVCLAYGDRFCNNFDFVTDDFLYDKYPSTYNQLTYHSDFWPVRWDAMPSGYAMKLFLRFDAKQIETTAYVVHWQSLIQSGWGIVAKNRSSGTTQKLGFIDAMADERSLTGIFLPDGDYEFYVLTSSYFWKDTIDRTVLFVSLKSGEEISSLPIVENLRSTITNGRTCIKWSTRSCELSDSVFGVWYSSESPVNIDRVPDTTVW